MAAQCARLVLGLQDEV